MDRRGGIPSRYRRKEEPAPRRRTAQAAPQQPAAVAAAAQPARRRTSEQSRFGYSVPAARPRAAAPSPRAAAQAAGAARRVSSASQQGARPKSAAPTRRVAAPAAAPAARPASVARVGAAQNPRQRASGGARPGSAPAVPRRRVPAAAVPRRRVPAPAAAPAAPPAAPPVAPPVAPPAAPHVAPRARPQRVQLDQILPVLPSREENFWESVQQLRRKEEEERRPAQLRELHRQIVRAEGDWLALKYLKGLIEATVKYTPPAVRQHRRPYLGRLVDLRGLEPVEGSAFDFEMDRIQPEVLHGGPAIPSDSESDSIGRFIDDDFSFFNIGMDNDDYLLAGLSTAPASGHYEEEDYGWSSDDIGIPEDFIAAMNAALSD